jgi:hypothetical protein
MQWIALQVYCEFCRRLLALRLLQVAAKTNAMMLMKVRWFLLGTGGLLLIVGAFLFHVVQTAFDDMCGNQIISEIPSQDRMYRVVAFQRSRGATTGFSTQVSVLKAGEVLPNESGNLFVADTDHGKAPSGIGGGPEVRISWVGLRSIRLTYHKNSRVFLSNSKVSEVFAVFDFFK